MQDRELAILPVGLLHGVQLGGQPCFASPERVRAAAAQELQDSGSAPSVGAWPPGSIWAPCASCSC